MLPRAGNFCCYGQCLLAGCCGRPEESRIRPTNSSTTINHEEIEAGKRHALIGMVKAHAASVQVILLLFSGRGNLLLLTLDGRRLHGK